ncbi:HetP family heterocyst commitment protein [Nostoc sp. UHCC 0702]|nr:HetP family heterocyst commitment protein [Nostoc sp. UHCC 0702]
MNYRISSTINVHSLITPEQLNEIIGAITEGRYSWACVLILRFIGHNPLHFIPQRTYSRLIKENSQISSTSLSITENIPASINSPITSSDNQSTSEIVRKINDLDYL